MSELMIWKAMTVFCVLIIILLFTCLFDANQVLNWYVKQYHSVPRINRTPRRKKYHEWLLRFFACTIHKPKVYLKKMEA
jgi:hypothetical protein